MIQLIHMQLLTNIYTDFTDGNTGWPYGPVLPTIMMEKKNNEEKDILDS